MKKLSLLLVLMLLLTACTPTPKIAPLWENESKKPNKIVVISDIHLGVNDDVAETVANRKFLVDFLEKLHETKDVKELVINGDFLDDWYLPLDYPAFTDVDEFYKKVIANNQVVFDELKHVMKAGIKVVYTPGNHDILLYEGVLEEALPGIIQARDVTGLGTYYTGERSEVAIEHGHRYDVFSAPDMVTNADMASGKGTVLPAGYFYARIAASWVLQGRPANVKNYPTIDTVPDKTDIDQYGAYVYYKVLSSELNRFTLNESIEDKLLDWSFDGINQKFSILDFFPVMQADGTISAPVLFKDIQRTWEQRQEINQVAVKTSFLEAVAGTLDYDYFAKQAAVQHLENPNENIEVVVFGHTHKPDIKRFDSGKTYINEGTWIDHNTNFPDADRTFAVITSGDTTTAALYAYEEDGSIRDISASVTQ